MLVEDEDEGGILVEDMGLGGNPAGTGCGTGICREEGAQRDNFAFVDCLYWMRRRRRWRDDGSRRVGMPLAVSGVHEESRIEGSVLDVRDTAEPHLKISMGVIGTTFYGGE
jgi:hypothetical protein